MRPSVDAVATTPAFLPSITVRRKTTTATPNVQVAASSSHGQLESTPPASTIRHPQTASSRLFLTITVQLSTKSHCPRKNQARALKGPSMNFPVFWNNKCVSGARERQKYEKHCSLILKAKKDEGRNLAGKPEGHNLQVRTVCKHIYHTMPKRTWLKSNCKSCRFPQVSTDLVPNSIRLGFVRAWRIRLDSQRCRS